MNDLDADTNTWLKTLKLNKNFKNVADFENGYNFGLIFDKLNLSKGKKFKNSSDMACIFQNYKNVRDLLQENFGYEFPINNIIYRTEELLHAVRDQCIKYNQNRRQNALKNISVLPGSTMQPLQKKIFSNREKQITMSHKTLYEQQKQTLPPKIMQIQKKLEKYREQKTKHQLLALQDRKVELDNQRRYIQQHRQFQLTKLRNNHKFMKEQQQKVNDVYMKTQLIKHARLQKERQFNSFMQSKKDKYYQSLRDEEEKNYYDGNQAFQLNCIRQGIQLQHDPDKPPKVTDDKFNRVVVMERIKDNIKKQQHDKKQRVKRQNRKKIDAQQAKLKSETLWSEINLISKYSQDMSKHFENCQRIHHQNLQNMAKSEVIKKKYKARNFVDLPQFGGEQERQAQLRRNRILTYQKDILRLQRVHKQKCSLVQDIIEAFLHVTITNHDKFEQNHQFSYSQWKEIQKQFLGFQSKQNKKKITNQWQYVEEDKSENQILNYINQRQSWKLFSDEQHNLIKNYDMGDALNKIIQISYPQKKVSQNNDIPLYMPLKVSFIGQRAIGKTTQSFKLQEKYGLDIINPKILVKEALQLAKPPPVQDPKKASKKDTKKIQEDTPQKIQLKEFGMKLLEKIENANDATIDMLIEAIKLRLKQLYKNKSEQQIVAQYQQAKEKQKNRYSQALKDFQQNQKKPKKDSKKGAVQIPQEPPTQNPYFYSKGFIIDDFPFNLDHIKLLERTLNCYISEEERLNPKAEQIRSQIKKTIPIPERLPDTNLHNGTFDFLFNLDEGQQNIENRYKNRKIDPTTNIIYHPQFNPIPTDIKGLQQKLIDLQNIQNVTSQQKQELKKQISKIEKFYKVFGDNRNKVNSFQIVSSVKPIQQTLKGIKDLISVRLQSKYKDIQDIQHKLQSAKLAQKVNIQAQKNSEQKQQQKQQEQKIQQKKSQEKEQQKQIKQTNQQQQKQENKLNEQLQQKQKQKQQRNHEVIYKQPSLVEIVNNLDPVESQKLVNNFTDISNKYMANVGECINELKNLRSNYLEDLLVVQKDFISIINRPDDKAGKILAFQENYNKLYSEKLAVVRDQQASKYLIKKLDQLYDSLWVSLQQKKNEAVNERKLFINSNWLELQIKKLMKIFEKLLQTQLNFMVQQIFFIFKLNCMRQGLPIDFMQQYLNLEPIKCVVQENVQSNPRMDYFLKQMKKCLQSAPQWSLKKQKKLKAKHCSAIKQLWESTLKTQQKRIQQKMTLIQHYFSSLILEQKTYFQALVNKMDDWIIFGIKLQNDSIYDIYKTLKGYITQVKKSTIKQISKKYVTDIHQPIKQLTHCPIRVVIRTGGPLKVPVYSYKIFLQEIKCLSNREGKIEFNAFQHYFKKRSKSKLFTDDLLKLDFDTMHQFLVTEDYCNFKELALAMLLINVKVCDEQFLNDYANRLKAQYGKSKLKISQFPPASLLYKQIGVNVDAATKLEDQILKQLIFQIFRNQYDEIDLDSYVQTLLIFNQLQVLRYGDTVMMIDY